MEVGIRASAAQPPMLLFRPNSQLAKSFRPEGEIPRGSKFSFTISYLPVEAEDEIIFYKTCERNKPFANKFALVVEPDAIKYKYLEKMLEASGFTVQRAVDVHQWFDFISKTNRIDVVMIDAIVLEQASDAEISRIKTVRAGLPIIIIGRQNDQSRFYKKHATLENPITYAKILEVMKRSGIE